VSFVEAESAHTVCENCSVAITKNDERREDVEFL